MKVNINVTLAKSLNIVFHTKNQVRLKKLNMHVITEKQIAC